MPCSTSGQFRYFAGKYPYDWFIHQDQPSAGFEHIVNLLKRGQNIIAVMQRGSHENNIERVFSQGIWCMSPQMRSK